MTQTTHTPTRRKPSRGIMKTLTQEIYTTVQADDDDDDVRELKHSPSALPDPSLQPKIPRVSWRQIFRSIGMVARPFFTSKRTRVLACSLLSVVLGAIFLQAWLLLELIQLLQVVTDAMVAFDTAEFWSGIRGTGRCTVLLVIVVIIMWSFKGMMTYEWRRFLTHELLDGYIGPSKAYYYLKTNPEVDIDNPDQRICQDIGEFTEGVPDVLLVVVQAVVTILAQSGLLISVDIKLFLYVVVYGVVFTVTMLFIFGGQLIHLNRKVLAQEASLRFALVRVREHAEAIAFLDGEDWENEKAKELFVKIIRTLYRRMCVLVPMGSIHTLADSLARILPYIILAGKYFNGEIKFGSVTVATTVFHVLSQAFTTLVHILPRVANVGAQSIRVQQIWSEIRDDRLEGGLTDNSHGWRSKDDTIQYSELPLKDWIQSKCLLKVTNLTVQTPASEAPLVRELSLELKKGEALMISGPSGMGKSSLLRVLGKLWRRGSGQVAVCKKQDVQFLPQEPYLCVGSLADNASYPEKLSSEHDESIISALNAVNIGYLLDRVELREQVDLDTMLSQGEKQRLAFVRLLLRPRVRLALLDEATSAQDDNNENNLYTRLHNFVDAYVSIAHKMNLEKFHTQRLLLERLSTGGCSFTLRPLEDPVLPTKGPTSCGCSSGPRVAAGRLLTSS